MMIQLLEHEANSKKLTSTRRPPAHRSRIALETFEKQLPTTTQSKEVVVLVRLFERGGVWGCKISRKNTTSVGELD